LSTASPWVSTNPGVRDFTALSGFLLGLLGIAALVGGSVALGSFAAIAAPVILIASIAAGGLYVYHQETQTDRILGDRFQDFEPCDVDYVTPIRQLAAEGLVSLALDKVTGAGTKKLLGGFGWGDEFLEIVDKVRGALLGVAPNPIAQTGSGALLADKTKCLPIVEVARNLPPTTDPPATDPPTTNPPVIPGPVKTVEVFSNPDLTGFLSPGTVVQFSAVARDANGNVVGCTPRFTVSNPVGSNVANIDPNMGVLTMGPDEGAVSVTATCDAVTSGKPILVSGSGSGPPDAPAASPFDGVYVGTYSGSATVAGITVGASGQTRITVTNGAITVQSPGGGSGSIGALGSANSSTSGQLQCRVPPVRSAGNSHSALQAAPQRAGAGPAPLTAVRILERGASVGVDVFPNARAFDRKFRPCSRKLLAKGPLLNNFTELASHLHAICRSLLNRRSSK